LPVFLGSLAITEAFSKLRSLLLEAIAFLLTWYVLGGVVETLRQLFAKQREITTAADPPKIGDA
jgi:hypothetical protein